MHERLHKSHAWSQRERWGPRHETSDRKEPKKQSKTLRTLEDMWHVSFYPGINSVQSMVKVLWLLKPNRQNEAHLRATFLPMLIIAVILGLTTKIKDIWDEFHVQKEGEQGNSRTTQVVRKTKIGYTTKAMFIFIKKLSFHTGNIVKLQ